MTSMSKQKSRPWPRLKAFLWTFLVTSVLLLAYRPSMEATLYDGISTMTIFEEYSTLSSTMLTKTNSYKWNFTEKFSESWNRTILVVNGVAPGPLIEVFQNDIVSVAMFNDLHVAVTIHWHGISQFHSNDEDGTPSVVQDAILPGATFKYKFQAQNSGTFWWHAHSGGSRLEGLAGPLVVHPIPSTDEASLLSVAQHNLTDVAVLVSDWYELTTDSNASSYLDKNNTDLTEPRPDAICVNGQIFGSGKHATVFTLSAKDRTNRYIRLRFINSGAIASIVVKARLPNKPLLILEADATLVLPINVSSFHIAVGQRYSLLIDSYDYARNADIELDIALDMSRHSHGEHNNMNEHELQQQAIKVSEKLGLTPSLHDGMLHPLSSSQSYAGRPVHEISTGLPVFTLSLGIERRIEYTRSTINNISYVPANRPLIEQFYDSVAEDNSTRLSMKYSPDILTLSIAQGEEVLLLLNNAGPGPHPFHIHGHDMRLLATNTFFHDPLNPKVRPSRDFDPFSIPSLLAAANGVGTLGPASLFRDTIEISAHGWALVSIKGGGRGLWAAHCHIYWHELSGMMMVLEVR